MKLTINENIKRLRREKNITQEKLAEYLNVSIQAVSKWERGETMPDITMILPIASYFNVSTDELLGVDKARDEAKILEYYDEYQKLTAQGKQAEMTELVLKAYKEFPNDFRVMSYYSQYLIGSRASHYGDDIVLSRADEAIALCERILAECPIDGWRNEAIITLSVIEKARGNVDKALESLGRLPHWYTTCGQTSEQLFPKDTAEFRYWVSKNFYELVDFAHDKLLKMIWFFDNPFEEKLNQTLRLADYLIKLLEEIKCELIYKLIYATYSEIGRQCRFAEKHEEIAKYYDISLSYAQKFDEFIESNRESNYVTQGIKHDITLNTWNTERHKYSFVKGKLTWLENNPWFEEARKYDNFNAMIEKYKPFAKDYELK